jgi:subtilisin-like proprotein convertase family protein
VQQTTDKYAGRPGLSVFRRTVAAAAAAAGLLLAAPGMAQTFNGTGTGAIPDATTTGTFGNPLNVSFAVSGIGGSISNISLSTSLTHTWVGDLEVVLAPPGVTPGNAGSFVIFSRVGATDAGATGDSSNLGGTYVFANSAANNIWTAAAAAGDGDIIPAGNYRTVVAAPSVIPAAVTDFTAAFSGLTPAQINGNWTLRFRDRGAADVGSVSAAALTLTVGGGGGGPGGTWLDLGPGPAHNGQVEGITNRPVTGAVNAVAPHPTDAAILYAGAVNGGIWRTTNATAATPTWTRQTDTQTSQSITALRLDPTDATHQTLLAGVGRNSSIGGDGGALTGLLRTTNGGTTWTALNGGGTLTNKDIRAVAPRGAVLLAAATDGLYRSADTGASFTLVSGAGGSGLPSGRPTDLVGDPGNNSLLYTVMFNSAAPGIYRSTNAGSTWTKVSDAPTDTLITNGTRGMLAVGQSSNVFLAVVGGNGRLSAIIRSANGTSGWTNLGFPTTAEEAGALFGVHPGGQGSIHLSLAADPTDANIVYIGGDRQPYFSEAAPGSGVFFPNSLGALDYSGRLFRGNASLAPASRWTSLTHSGAGNNSAPHADSRAMAFDADGNLIQSDDGGVYKRNTPRTTTGAWVSLNGDLQVTEYHGIAYDGLADRVIGGAQDTGTTQQQQAASRTFISVHTGDGGDPVVDDISSATISSRYSSFQNLQVFRRRTYNAADVFQAQTFPALTPLAGSPAIDPQFYSPVAVNKANGLRLLIGADNGVYESADQGATVTRIATVVVNGESGDALEYGVPGNGAFIYLASGNNLYLRTTGSGAPTLINTIGALTLRDVAVDPAQPSRLFALSSSIVWFSSTSGAAYANVTGNLGTLSPGSLRSMVYVPRPSGDILVVGADRGVFYALSSAGFTTWQALGTGLPRVPVYELAYHAPRDALIAGTLGRGAWRLNGVATGGGGGDSIFRNGFE